jgi:hypothetical protein
MKSSRNRAKRSKIRVLVAGSVQGVADRKGKGKRQRSGHGGAVGAVSRDGRGSSAVLREAAIRFRQYYAGPEGRSK